jgi:flagellar biosynthesis/type III secretory pathway M-ring protein FliF/YscJ
MNENRRKLVILLAALLAVFILNSGAAIAQTPSEEALKAWQQLSEEDLFRIVQHLSNLGSQSLY